MLPYKIDLDSFKSDLNENSVRSVSDIKPILEMLRSHMPVKYDDLVISSIFVDLSRYPVALLSKTRTSNFPGFKNHYYTSLKNQLQSISNKSMIYHLVKERNVIVINDIDDLENSELGDEFEKKYIIETGMLSSIFHTLFYEEVEFGFLGIFTLETKLKDYELELILDYLRTVLPYFSQKIFPAAYTWQQKVHQIEIQEIQEHMTDLIISITSSGEIVKVNSVASYYLGMKPEKLLGKNLQDISPKLFQGIQNSLVSPTNKYVPLIVDLKSSSGQIVSLELNTWETDIASHRTIVCYATDISLLKVFHNNKNIN